MKPRPGYISIEVTRAQARALLALLDQEPLESRFLLARAFPGTSDGQRMRRLDCAMKVADALQRALDDHTKHERLGC